MSRTYTATVPVTISTGGNELNLLAQITFTHVPAYRGSGPTYSHGGLPPEPESVEDRECVSLWIDEPSKSDDANLIWTKAEGKPAPAWLLEWIAENIDEAELLEAIPDGPDPDDARDRAIDDELTDRANRNHYTGRASRGDLEV